MAAGTTNKLLLLLPLVSAGCMWNTNTAVGACRAYRYTLNSCLMDYNAQRAEGEAAAELMEREACDEYIDFGDDLTLLSDELIDDLEAFTANGFNCGREIVQSMDCSEGVDVSVVLGSLGDCDFGD